MGRDPPEGLGADLADTGTVDSDDWSVRYPNDAVPFTTCQELV